MLASPQTSVGVRLSRIHLDECVTNERQRTSAGRLLACVTDLNRSLVLSVAKASSIEKNINVKIRH